jgi:flagellar biogenesis protein FliO
MPPPDNWTKKATMTAEQINLGNTGLVGLLVVVALVLVIIYLIRRF